MTTIRNISATFFDMDGTLVDSETLTEPTVQKLCNELGVHDADIEPTQLYGLSWLDIERILVNKYPQLANKPDIPAHIPKQCALPRSPVMNAAAKSGSASASTPPVGSIPCRTTAF